MFGGAGLGLNIARNITLSMGGDITVESEVDVGSTFTATFLFDVVADNARSTSSLLDPSRLQLSFDSRVLVVDDIDTNLDVAETVLRDLGCTV